MAGIILKNKRPAENSSNKMKTLCMHLAAIAVITVLSCIHIREADYIFVINDEFGYWAHAISAVGYDWKELIFTTPYYTWGYSIWLIPIIALLPTPAAWYKAAILLNVLFLILSYFFCYQTGRRLFREADERVVAAVSVLVVIYPANIVYAQAAWTETLSYLLVWIETYLIICLDEKFSNKNFVSAALVLVYAYAVHNRSIGVVLAGILSLCLVLIKHKKNFCFFPILGLIMLMGYEGVELVKNHQIEALWSSSQTSNMNNVSLNTATIVNYSSRIFEQTEYFLISLFGKYIYLLIATGLTLPIAVWKMLKDVVGAIKARDLWRDYRISKIWMLLAAAFMYGICAIGVSGWKFRSDLVVYSRYMENAFGPILFLAIMYCIEYVREARVGLLISGFSLVVGIKPVYYWITHTNDAYFNTICSPVVGAFYEAVYRNRMFTAFILLAGTLIAAFIVLFAVTYCKKKAVRTGIILLSFALTYCMIGNYANKYALNNRKSVDTETTFLYDLLRGGLEDNEIYYVKDAALDATCMNPKYFQFLIPEKTIHVVAKEELQQIPDENVIIMVEPQDKEAAAYFEGNVDAEMIDESWLFNVYAVEGN